MQTEVVVCVCEFLEAAVGVGGQFLHFADYILVTSLDGGSVWLKPGVVAEDSKFLFHYIRVIFDFQFSVCRMILSYRPVVLFWHVAVQAVPDYGAQGIGVLARRFQHFEHSGYVVIFRAEAQHLGHAAVGEHRLVVEHGAPPDSHCRAP